MQSKAVLASGAITAALVFGVTWAFDISFSRAALLAPVIVAAVGAGAAVVVLWVKVVRESLARRERPWLILGIALATVALIAALSVLGLELPRE